MGSYNDNVRIRTSLAKAHDALTRQKGYEGWWSKNCKIAESAGGESKLQFDKGGRVVNMRFRVDAIEPKQIRWTCVGHDSPDWVGTTLHWTLTPHDDSVDVAFEHGGWKGNPPDMVIQGWKHFLQSLKSYLETGKGEPW